MGKWLRLVLTLAIIAVAGIMLVHRRTAVTVKGYGISGLITNCENKRDENRKIRICLERELAPQAVREKAKVMGIELGEAGEALFGDSASVKEYYELTAGGEGTGGGR